MELARSYNNLGVLFQDTGRLKEAETLFGDALAIQKHLAVHLPLHAPTCARNCRGPTATWACCSAPPARWEEAEAAYAEALAIRKQLAADFPTVPEYRNDLATSHGNLGLLYGATNRLKEAEAEYDRALAIHKQLAADFPTQPKFRSHLARTHANLGGVYHSADRFKEAEAAFAESVAIVRKLAADFPDQTRVPPGAGRGQQQHGSRIPRHRSVEGSPGRLRRGRERSIDNWPPTIPPSPTCRTAWPARWGIWRMSAILRDDFSAAKGYLEEARAASTGQP